MTAVAMKFDPPRVTEGSILSSTIQFAMWDSGRFTRHSRTRDDTLSRQVPLLNPGQCLVSSNVAQEV